MSERPPSPSRAGFAVVTGGAKRLGAAFAKALAADGWLVRLHYNGSAEAAHETAGAIRAAGGRCDGPPGLRAEYHPSYYAAFLLDPDGNNIEAVFHGEADRSAVSVEITFES